MKTIETAELWTVILLAHDIQSSCSSSSGGQSTKSVISRLVGEILTLQNRVGKKNHKKHMLGLEVHRVLNKQTKAKVLLVCF